MLDNVQHNLRIPTSRRATLAVGEPNREVRFLPELRDTTSVTVHLDSFKFDTFTKRFRLSIMGANDQTERINLTASDELGAETSPMRLRLRLRGAPTFYGGASGGLWLHGETGMPFMVWTRLPLAWETLLLGFDGVSGRRDIFALVLGVSPWCLGINDSATQMFLCRDFRIYPNAGLDFRAGHATSLNLGAEALMPLYHVEFGTTPMAIGIVAASSFRYSPANDTMFATLGVGLYL